MATAPHAAPADVHEFAYQLVCATTLEGKLAAPGRALFGRASAGGHPGALDGAPAGDEAEGTEPGAAHPREPLRLLAPGRPSELAICLHRKVHVPSLEGMTDPAQRARIIHAMANHELQAVELFAWALLAFPAAPAGFRRGLLAILAEEQRHCRLYLERLAAHGVAFGDHPVTGHFWNKLEAYQTPLSFVCAMGLTFENANLDFAGETARAARAAGDEATALALEEVHADEVRHVAFAWRWLHALAPGQEAWATYLGSLPFPLGPRRARGHTFDRAAREAAGLDADFIDRLEASAPQRGNHPSPPSAKIG